MRERLIEAMRKDGTIGRIIIQELDESALGLSALDEARKVSLS
jgi:hypothetical protein